MPGVVIVDDEALSRMGLRAMLDWEAEGFYLIGEAENGKKGLDIIISQKPDIVITDIKMPVMDGLEMINRARREVCRTRYIVLTSYEEFGLLKTAMEYGVAEYLLKLELTPESLRLALKKQSETLEIEKEGRDIAPAKKAARALRRILYGQENTDAGPLLQFKPGIDISAISCAAVRYSLKSKGASGEDRHSMESAVYSVVNSIVSGFFEGVTFFTDNGLCLFVYSPGADAGEKLKQMCGVVIHMLRQYLNVASSVGVTELVRGAGDVRLVMEDAIKATDEVFYEGYGKILRAPAHPEEESGPAPAPGAAPHGWQEALTLALEFRDAEKLLKVFGALRQALEENPRPPRREAYDLCFSAACLSLSAIKKDPASKGFFGEDVYAVIGEIETLAGLRDWLAGFEAELLEMLSSIPQKSYDDHIVTAAKRFVAENLDKPVNLTVTAERLSISSGYLSQVFKRKTNTGFVEYVTKTKMSEAKRLLLLGKYKIYEVSQLVGYEDTSYFSKIFNKYSGLSPKEYIALNR